MNEINPQAEWNFPTKIVLSAGSSRDLEDMLFETGITSVLVITDRGMASSTSLKKLLKRIDKSSVAFGVFSALDGPADRQNLEIAVRLYRSGSFNGIIGFGGGSAIDLAKLVALFYGNDVDCHHLLKPAHNIVLPPVIAIPTLAGSGAEVRTSTYLADYDGKTSQIIDDQRLCPTLVVLDPELNTTAPPALIAGAGMNALIHAIDSWCSPSFNPIADAVAIETMRLIFEYLPKAVAKPTDINAQAYIMSASLSGALAATKGLGATTAIAHSVCQFFHTHYGMTAGVLLPYVLAFNQPVIEERINLLNTRLGIKDGFAGFARNILKLRKSIMVPTKLSGIIREHKSKVTDKAIIDKIAIQDLTRGDTPIKLTKSAVQKIINAAIIGKMNQAQSKNTDAKIR